MLSLRPLLMSLTACAFCGSVSAQLVEKINQKLLCEPTWAVLDFEISPDGEWVLCHGDHDGDGWPEIYSVPATGGPMRTLRERVDAPGLLLLSDLLFSPDGDRAVFISDLDSSTRLDLYSAPSDGSGPTVKLSGTEEVRLGARIVGDRVVFRAYTAPSQTQLYSVPLDGSAPPMQLGPSLPAGGSVVFGHDTLVTPLGDRAIFIGDCVTNDVQELFSVLVDGSAPAVRLNGTLPVNGGVIDSWLTPDGTHALYLASEQQVGRFDLYVVPVDASGPPVRLSAIPVAGGDVHEATGTSDGRVVYTADALLDERIDLFSVPLDGSAAPIQLNPVLGTNGSVQSFQLAGSRALYRVSTALNMVELFSVPVDGSASATRLNATLPTNGSVTHLVGASATRALYVADQDTNEKFELYSAALDGSGTPLRLSGALGADADVLFASLSPNGERAAFVAGVFDDIPEAWSVPLDGSLAPTRLAAGASARSSWTFGYGPRFAPDGRVVFPTLATHILQDGAIQDTLWSYDGSATIELTPGIFGPEIGDVVDFAWSPDGRRLAYVAELRDGSDALVAVGVNDRQEELHTFARREGILEARLRFTPDSERILVESRTDFSSNTGLSLISLGLADPLELGTSSVYGASYVFTDDGRFCCVHLKVELFDPPGKRNLNPSNTSSKVALDLSGRRMVFGSTTATNGRLYTSPLDTIEESTPIDAPSHASSAILQHEVRGPRTYFLSNQVNPSGVELWSVPNDGSAAPMRLSGPLVSGGSVGTFQFVPDGSRILYRSSESIAGVTELYSVRPDGSGRVKLSGPMAAGGDVSAFFVSPSSIHAVYQADQTLDNVLELYSVPVDGSAAPQRLHAPLSGQLDAGSDVDITPDGTTVVFVAALAQAGVEELYAAPIDASAPPLRLSADFPPGGSLFAVGGDRVALSPGGRHVYYLAEQITDGVNELFSVPIDGSRAPLRRNAPLVAGGQVLEFELGPPGAVLYRADQDTDEVHELYLSSFPDSAPPRSPASTPSRSTTTTVQNP